MCQKCPTYQKNSIKNYGLLLEKETEAIPWDNLYADLIRPYEIKNINQDITLWCLTMIDTATLWLEIEDIITRMH